MGTSQNQTMRAGLIGEASKNIERVAPEFVDVHPELPLAFAYDMRNPLSHGFYKVDMTVVWKTIEKDLPYLQKQFTIAIHKQIKD